MYVTKGKSVRIRRKKVEVIAEREAAQKAIARNKPGLVVRVTTKEAKKIRKFFKEQKHG